MSPSERREVEHDITVSATASAVYHLIEDVAGWPRLFPPTIHVEIVDKHEREERMHIWATANDTVKDWISHRILAPNELRIDFRQEVSRPPVAEMGGAWIVDQISDDECRVRLLHHYRATTPQDLNWVDEVVDRNSRSELAALKANIELRHATEGHTFSFEDALHIRGSASDVYHFIGKADLWPQRLPHVATVQLGEDASGIQTLEMDTKSPDGSTHRTKSYRVLFPHHKIAYKQVTLPALMSLHTGYWTFAETDDGVTASSQHTVVLKADNIAKVLGPDADIENGKNYVRNALSTNSLATLQHAKEYAERGRGK